MGDGHGPWRRSCESLNEGERELWAGQWQMQTYKEIRSEKEPRLPEGRDGGETRKGRQAAEVPETRKPEQSRELAGGSHGQLLDVAHGRYNTKKPSSSELADLTWWSELTGGREDGRYQIKPGGRLHRQSGPRSSGGRSLQHLRKAWGTRGAPG